MYSLLIKILLLTYINSNVIQLEISDFYYSIPNPSFYFTKEQFWYHILLNTYSSGSIFWMNFNAKYKSDIIKNLTLYNDDNYNVTHYLTDIKINQTALNNFSIYVSKTSLWTRDTGIALGYHFNDTSFSIVHSLYNSKKIDKLQFAYEKIGKHDNFYIGGVPENKILNFTYKGVVEIDEKLPTWGFNLEYIKYIGTNFKMNLPTIIHSAMENMIISDDVFDFFYSNVLQDKMINNECDTRTNGIYGQKYFRCRLDEERLSTKIEFVFDNIQVEFTIKDLFNYSNSKIVSNSDKPFHKFNGVFLGIDFIRMMNYTIFDYENTQVSFYSDTIKISSKSKEKLQTKPLIIIVISLCGLLCAMLLYIKYLYKTDLSI